MELSDITSFTGADYGTKPLKAFNISVTWRAENFLRLQEVSCQKSDLSKPRYTLRAEIFVIINCCGTYFCNFGPKLQKFDPQNRVWISQS